MANLIRNAANLGYKLIPYEDTIGKKREMHQAENLYNKTLKNDPDAKVLVLAGGSHINEIDSQDSDKRWMAYYLKKISKLDPLTINQEKYERYKIDEGNIDYNVGIADVNLSDETSNDLYLINKYNENDFKLYPEAKQYKITRELPEIKNKTNGEILLQIYQKSEYLSNQSAIPIKNFVYDTNPKKISLTLPEGEYILLIKNRLNEILCKEDFRVNK